MQDEFKLEGSKIIPVDIEREMKKSYLDYSMSVIVGRALPDVRDGLKPVHRRILYTMHENGLTPDKAYRKSADTVGSVLGRYHPHGDMSVYDALVRMAQNFSLRYPLVDGHGNFGSVDGDPPAAYRYTEARMSKMALHMLAEIDKDTVDFTPNYDDRLEEPRVLPSRFPNLLVNGSTGIAVGMATNIPPHNLREVVGAICLLIDDPDATLEQLMEHIKGPDFPTAGIIMGRSGIRAAYGTGRGKITLRSRCEIEEMANGKQRIIVTEIPYMVNKARLVESIAQLVKDKRVDGITDLREESDREGMRIVIELKRDINAQVLLNRLFSYTQMQETVGVIMLALVNGEPKVLTLKEMLCHYIDYQAEIVRRRTEFNLKKARERAHILEALKTALDFIDEVIAILRGSKTIPEGKEALMQRFGFDDVQATAIVQMRLGQLTGLEKSKIEEELAELMLKIAEFLEILGDYQKILGIVRTELLEICDKFGDDRKTEIQAVSGEVDIEDLIPEEDCVVTLTHYGYIKRQPVDVYKAQRRGGRGITGMTRREEDFVEELFVCSSHDYILFFTSKGRMFRLKCYEVPEASRVARGSNIVNILQLSPEEKVTSVITLKGMPEDTFVVMVTRQGIIKRTRLEEYRNVRRSGINAVNLDEGDELAWVKLTEGDSQLIVATRKGMAIRFDENDVRPMSRQARGVIAIRLSENDAVVGMARVRENAKLLTVTDQGYGRFTEISEYRLQSRGGKGITNYKDTHGKGQVCAVRIVGDDDDIILISDDGVIIRFAAEEISTQSRYGGGVRVMRVAEDAKVVTLARAPKEDMPEEEAEEESDSAEETQTE